MLTPAIHEALKPQVGICQLTLSFTFLFSLDVIFVTTAIKMPSMFIHCYQAHGCSLHYQFCTTSSSSHYASKLIIYGMTYLNPFYYAWMCTDGSVVESSPATRGARVRFPVSAWPFFFSFQPHCFFFPPLVQFILKQVLPFLGDSTSITHRQGAIEAVACIHYIE